MAHAIRSQRVLLQEALQETPVRTDQALVDRVSACLTPSVILNGNPFAEGVLHALDLRPKDINGATVEFRSLSPDVLADDGSIVRGAEPRPAQVGISIRCGVATATNVMRVVIMERQRALPLVELKVMGSVKLESISCEMRLIDNYEGLARVREGTVRLRGNTALRKAKKSYYHLEFCEPHGIAGFAPSRHLFLTSTYQDPTLMHNSLAYDLFRSFARTGQPRYTPHVCLVEVVVNNNYQGVYEMTERVDAELREYADPYWDVDHPAVLYKSMGSRASFCRPSHREYVQKVPNWKNGEFWGPYTEFASFIAYADESRFAAEAENLIDVNNIIDFEILLNVTANWEGRDYNLYIARRAGHGQKFFLVPWDYDVTFHVPTGILKNCLIERLHDDLPGYEDRLRARWQELRTGPLATSAMLHRIDNLDAVLATGPADRNFQRWRLPSGKTHAQHVDTLRTWVTARLALLDNYFNSVRAHKNPETDFKQD